MKIDSPHNTLLANLKTLDGISEKTLKRIESAMIEYALKQVADYKGREIKNVFLYSFKYFPRLTWDNIIWWLRRLSFNIAKRQAQTRANIENRKCYVIRKSLIGYTVLSTLDINLNKKLRILEKDVNAIKLHEVSDFVVYPKNEYP
jgi:hypothetical protein